MMLMIMLMMVLVGAGGGKLFVPFCTCFLALIQSSNLVDEVCTLV